MLCLGSSPVFPHGLLFTSGASIHTMVTIIILSNTLLFSPGISFVYPLNALIAIGLRRLTFEQFSECLPYKISSFISTLQ